MRTGVLTMNTDEGINLLDFAREVEDLGIESVFVPDHSHADRAVALDAAHPDSPTNEV